MKDDLSEFEKDAIHRLQLVSDDWPKTLWLFSASGTLWVMRYGASGERMMIGSHTNQTVDPDYIVDEIDIPNDGGDW